MRQDGAAAFDKMVDDIAERIHDVNLLTDARTVLGFNALYTIILNPHYPNDLIPVDTCEITVTHAMSTRSFLTI
jgi:hypothetical protein